MPSGVPQTVRTSSNSLGVILVEWDPLLLNETNGVIISYTVQYHSLLSTHRKNATDTFTLINISPGETYVITVAAWTRIGIGPFSEGIVQSTISDPPSFLTSPLSSSSSVSTISITLPRAPGVFRYVRRQYPCYVAT